MLCWSLLALAISFDVRPAGEDVAVGEKNGQPRVVDAMARNVNVITPEPASARTSLGDGGNGSKAAPGEIVDTKLGKKTDAPKEKQMDLTNHFKILGVILVIMVVCVMWFERWVWQTDWQDAGAEPIASDQGQRVDIMAIFSGLCTLSLPYWRRCTTKSCLYGGSLIFFILLGLLTSFVHNTWRQQFWDNFEGGTEGEFRHLMVILLVLIAVEMLSGVYSQYVRWLLYIDWRTEMTTRYVNSWLDQKSYCEVARMKAIDNPDQRVQEDISIYTERTIGLSFDFCHQVGHLCLFLPLLVMLSPDKAFGLFYCPGWLVYMVGAYAAAGTLGAHYLGKQLIPINFSRQRREADFRYQLIEVRDNAEQIGMTNGEGIANEKLGVRFKAFRDAWWHYMQINKRLMYFKHFFGTVNWLVPFCILAPSFFAEQLTLGELFQLIHVIGKVEESMDWIINSYEPLSDWRATADRLLAFEKAVEMHVQTPQECAAPPTSSVEGIDLRLMLPDGTKVWECSRVTIPRGWVLVTGEGGIGLTCLLKMFAGLWPSYGSVCISANRVFVPEEPYLPNTLTLREALLYPSGGAKEDSELEEAVRVVGLPQLLEGDGLNATNDWMRSLSLGERQRLTVAQLLVQPTPDTIFFDKSFSHVSATTALELCGLLKSRCQSTNVVQVASDVDSMRSMYDVHMEASVVKGKFALTAVGGGSPTHSKLRA